MRLHIYISRLPILEEHEDSEEMIINPSLNPSVLSRYPRWFTLGHIEVQQCALASTMLSAAKSKYEIFYSVYMAFIKFHIFIYLFLYLMSNNLFTQLL